MSVASWLLVLICCSTWLNDTSSWVNWFVSVGASGSWFLSCVVSSVRNVSKFCVKLSTPVGSVPFAVVLVPSGGVGGGEVTGAVVVIGPSSDVDIERARVAAQAGCDGRDHRIGIVRVGGIGPGRAMAGRRL